jgi:hypothetical protein
MAYTASLPVAATPLVTTVTVAAIRVVFLINLDAN